MIDHQTRAPSSGLPQVRPTDDDLLERTVAGDHDALSELVVRFADQLLIRAERVVRNRAIAEEIVQDLWVTLAAGGGGFDAGRGSAAAWLTTIVHRRAVDRVRSTAAAQRRDRLFGNRSGAVTVASAEETSEIVWARGHLRRAIEQLTPVQQTAIRLSFFEGLSQPQIGRELGILTRTASTRRRDALLRLRALLEPVLVTRAE